MYLSYLANAGGIAAELSLYEKWISSAKVILTGFAVVFAVLFLLIGIIKIYSTIVQAVQNKNNVRKNFRNQKKEKIAQPDDSLKKPSIIPARKSDANEPVVSDGIDEEIVAVIAAAVAATYGSKGKARIKSIKKSGGRSAWANAGILDNTRPF